MKKDVVRVFRPAGVVCPQFLCMDILHALQENGAIRELSVMSPELYVPRTFRLAPRNDTEKRQISLLRNLELSVMSPELCELFELSVMSPELRMDEYEHG